MKFRYKATLDIDMVFEVTEDDLKEGLTKEKLLSEGHAVMDKEIITQIQDNISDGVELDLEIESTLEEIVE